MVPRSLAFVPLVMACTRPNPAFDAADDAHATSTEGPAGTTRASDPDAETKGPSSSRDTGDDVGASATGPSATAATTESTTNVNDSTGPPLESTGDCAAVMVQLGPIADAFIASGEGSCGGNDCQSVNMGASPQGLIDEVDPNFPRYLLMSFDLTEMPAPPLSATLTVTVGHGAEVDLAVSEVFPSAWSEGDGIGSGTAAPGEATWLWSANPDPWTTSRGSGTFELVLASALGLGSTNVPFVVGSHPVTITLDANQVDEWAGGPAVVHLVVTKTAGTEEVIAFSRESVVSPTLTITGC